MPTPYDKYLTPPEETNPYSKYLDPADDETIQTPKAPMKSTSGFKGPDGVTIPKMYSSGGGKLATEPVPDTTFKDVLQFGRPLDISAAIAAGTKAAQMSPLPPIGKAAAGIGVGAATYLGLENIIQRALGQEPSVKDSAINLGVNELGSRVVGRMIGTVKGAVKGFQEGYHNTPATLQRRLGATAAQRLDSPIMEHVENIFANPDKQAALKTSGLESKKLIDELTAKVTGKSIPTITDQHSFADEIQRDVAKNYRRSQIVSNTFAEVSKNIGAQNREQVLTGFQTKQSPIIVPGQPAAAPIVTPIYEEVSGPVPVGEAYSWAQKILSEHPDPQLLVSSGEKAVYAKARDIALKSEVRDPTGKLIATRPISFNDAWTFKQTADELRSTDPRFKQLSQAFNKDIEAGISTWKNNGPSALKTWKLSKEEVQRRILTFEDDKSIAGLLKSNDSLTSEVSAALADPKRLQRLLVTQSGSGGGTNIKKLAQGYDLQEIIQNAYDPATQTYNANKILNAWGDPTRQASRKILYSATAKSEAENVLKAIADVSTKVSREGQAGTVFRVTNAGIMLGAGLINSGTSFLGHTNTIAANAVLGGAVGLKVLGKLATNPKTAPIIEKMIRSKPLGISERMAARMIFNSMGGNKIQLKLSDGREVEGEINSQGQINLK